jgi:hypothetical protein
MIDFTFRNRIIFANGGLVVKCSVVGALTLAYVVFEKRRRLALKRVLIT